MVKKDAQSTLFDSVDEKRFAYDEVPYTSHAFPQTNPLYLQGVAKLFGLTTADPAKARVLEIGCAAGGNIVTIANNFPASQCVGIDYSKKQIEEGQALLKAVSLPNLTLKHLSVTDIAPDFGEFDYIICHGVMSWVLPDVQDRIFEVCRNNLAKDGVAFISFNTLPGWNTVRTARDMMIYHTARFSDIATKAQQSKLLLKFVGDAMKANNNPMATFLERELELISAQPDSYVLHDHLEENNSPFYFHDFMRRAGQKGLQYLADTSLETMFTGNFSAEVAQTLATSDDLVRTEQYMDFITNRRFRNTLLCHKDRILSRNIQSEAIADGYVISCFAYPENFDTHDISAKQFMSFRAPNGIAVNSDDAVCMALMRVLMGGRFQPLAVADIPARVAQCLKQYKISGVTTDPSALASQVQLLLLRYIFMGGVLFFLAPYPCATTVTKKPEVSMLARYQATRQPWISGKRHESVGIDTFDAIFIPFLDGTRDEAALAKAMLPHFISKKLTLYDKGVAIEDEAEIKKYLPELILRKLKRFAEIGLLEE